MSNYIPDLTERFPEGFGGIDMTPAYFGEPVYRENEVVDYPDEDIPSNNDPSKFEVGKEYCQFGIFGGVTYYKVEKIDRDNNKILLSEIWHDVDGSGTRPAKWHKLDVDTDGNEKALDWTSKQYGDIWISA